VKIIAVLWLMRDLSTEVAVAVVLHDLSAALDTPTTPSSWRKALSTPQALEKIFAEEVIEEVYDVPARRSGKESCST